MTPLLLTAQDEMARLKAAIGKLPQPPSVVIIDTLSQTFSGDENSSSDIGTYLRMINSEIRASFNCTVIVIHHTGHSAAERPRGSSAITANLDFVLGVFKPDPEASRAKVGVHKMKDGDKVDDLYFNMTRLVLGEDSDGDEISSLVAAHDEAGQFSQRAEDEFNAQVQALVQNIQQHQTQTNTLVRKCVGQGEPHIAQFIASAFGLNVEADKKQISQLIKKLENKRILEVAPNYCSRWGRLVPRIRLLKADAEPQAS